MRRACLAAAGLIALGNLFLHKPVSDVSDWLVSRLGFQLFDHRALVVIGGASAVAALGLALRMPRPAWTRERMTAVAGLGALTWAAHRWLLVANVELIHLLQFALIAALLWLGGASPQAAWLGSTATGIGDEVYQHLVIYAGRSDTYLDFNDMVLNGLGAGWAALLLSARCPDAGERTTTVPDPWSLQGRAWRWGLVAGVLVVVLPLAWWWDPPRLEPFMRLAATGRAYRVLSAPEGIAAMGLLWGMVIAVTAGAPRARSTAAVDRTHR